MKNILYYSLLLICRLTKSWLRRLIPISYQSINTEYELHPGQLSTKTGSSSLALSGGYKPPLNHVAFHAAVVLVGRLCCDSPCASYLPYRHERGIDLFCSSNSVRKQISTFPKCQTIALNKGKSIGSII